MSVRTSEFLRKVLPDEGYLIVATPWAIPGTTKTAWRNVVVDDIPTIQVQARTWIGEKKDVYFALASFKERRVWNPTKMNYREKKPGAWEYRTQANTLAVRSLWLDLDVKPDKPKHYDTQRAAATALVEFCRAVGLPRPMMVNSGYGVHVYWPLTDAVVPAEWKRVAEKLKAACVSFGLWADHAITADEARVLRVPGTTNFKRKAERPVAVVADADAHGLSELDAVLDKYISDNNVPVSAGKPSTGLPARTSLPAGVAGNIGATNDPLNGNALVYTCPAMAKLVDSRGANASYPVWVAGLSLARYCDQPEAMMLAVSDGHAGFKQSEATEKMASLTKGPTKCQTFWESDNATCEGCQHWRNIKSPSEVARPWRETPPPTTRELPAPPYPYTFRDGCVWVTPEKTADDENEPPQQMVLPYTLYPSRIMEQSTDEDEADERSTWIATLPRKGEFEFRMPQTLLSDPRKLHAFLLSRGMHINPRHAKATQFFMTAYLQELAKAIDRERVYERLGWHDKHSTFVLPDTVFHRTGETTHHAPTRTLEAITKNAFYKSGTLEGWLDAIRFYQHSPNPGYRVFFYATFGSSLLHMTTHKGVLIAASGETGRGKTTLLEGCASVHGHPEGMLVGGGRYGSTINALYEILGGLHSLPLFWDDTTEREPEEMREFMLHISTGKGKERMHGNKHDGRVVTWETMVLSSANTDDVHRVMATGKDSDPHLMRFVSVPFDEVDRSTDAKVQADKMKRSLRENFGHAGPIYIDYIVKNYDEVKELVLKVQEKFDRALGVTSDERHWSAMMAVSYVGGCIAYTLGLLPFDPRLDRKWMMSHINVMRQTHQQAASTSLDIFNEFLDAHVSNTLVIRAKASSSIDNVAHEPRGALIIRNELDTDRMYVAKAALSTYCNEVKANQRKLETELIANGVILRKNCFKVLGADTTFAQGQVRCWEIDRVALSKLKSK